MTKEELELGLELDKKIPRDVVSERDGGGGRKLSYLEGHYVIDRLNKVFGHLGWDKEIMDVRQIVNTTSRGEFPAYLVKVRLTVWGAGNNSFKEAYGYGADKSPQNAHELAIKEAVTDALKVAAKDLGMSMGLALYDKSQENVDDGEEEERTKAQPKAGSGNNGGAKPNQHAGVQPTTTATLFAASTPSENKPASTENKTPQKREELNSLISSTARVLMAKKLETLDSLKAQMQKLGGVDIKEALTDTQASEFLTMLRGRLNG